jgi:hypothetical protein
MDGMVAILFNRFVPEAYYRPFAKAARAKLSLPLILVGGLRSTEAMDEIVGSGDADFLALARPFVREPDLAKQIMAGRRGPVSCVSCNLCFKHEGLDALRCWRTPSGTSSRHFRASRIDRTPRLELFPFRSRKCGDQKDLIFKPREHVRPRSRGARRPSFASISPSPSKRRAQCYPRRGAGKAGCALHPRSRVQRATKRNAHEHTGSAEAIRLSLRGWFTAYGALFPATGFIATVISKKLRFSKT